MRSFIISELNLYLLRPSTGHGFVIVIHNRIWLLIWWWVIWLNVLITSRPVQMRRDTGANLKCTKTRKRKEMSHHRSVLVNEQCFNSKAANACFYFACFIQIRIPKWSFCIQSIWKADGCICEDDEVQLEVANKKIWSLLSVLWDCQLWLIIHRINRHRLTGNEVCNLHLPLKALKLKLSLLKAI